jgi:hypothetical protein
MFMRKVDLEMKKYIAKDGVYCFNNNNMKLLIPESYMKIKRIL